MAGTRGTRGMMAFDIGVAPPDRCDPSPKLRSVSAIAREVRG